MQKQALLLIPILCAGAIAGPVSGPLDEGYRQMYNLQFKAAHSTFQSWRAQHPDDPLAPVSDAAAYLFAEFDRLHILQSEFFIHDQHFITDHRLMPDSGLKQQFQSALATTRALAAKSPDEQNSQFAALLADGLESDYLALIEKRYAASFQVMKSGRQRAERLLAADPTFYDAWIAVGVENYMLSVKPAPVRWLLRLGGGQTDRGYGIEKLRLTAEKGHYLAPFAKLLLAVAALRDRNPGQAKSLLTELTRQYPMNPLYPLELARLSGPSAAQAGDPSGQPGLSQ